MPDALFQADIVESWTWLAWVLLQRLSSRRRQRFVSWGSKALKSEETDFPEILEMEGRGDILVGLIGVWWGKRNGKGSS